MADRFAVEHCLLETLRGADIGLWCARLHRDAIAGAGELNHRANHFTVFDELIKCGHEIDHQIAWRVGFDLFRLLSDADEIDHDLVTCRLFIAGCEITHARQRSLIDQNFDFGCLCWRGGPSG